MDVSNQAQPGGEELVSAVVEATELPKELVENELNDILETAGHRVEELTLEQLRSAMIAYLEQIDRDMNQTDN